MCELIRWPACVLAEDACILQLVSELLQELILRQEPAIFRRYTPPTPHKALCKNAFLRCPNPRTSRGEPSVSMWHTSCAMVMPHSRLKFSSSEALGASWVLWRNLSPLRELDLLLKLGFLSIPDLSSSSECLARFGDIDLNICLPEGIATLLLGASTPGLCHTHYVCNGHCMAPLPALPARIER